jgi:hypothetical protein
MKDPSKQIDWSIYMFEPAHVRRKRSIASNLAFMEAAAAAERRRERKKKDPNPRGKKR